MAVRGFGWLLPLFKVQRSLIHSVGEHLDLPPLSARDKDGPPGGGESAMEAKGGKEEELSMVPIIEGIQPVLGKIVQKVDRNEFVDLADLLQDQFPTEEFTLPASHSGLVLVQSLETLKKKKKKITDFQAWVEALMVFVAIKCRRSNPEVAGIMAYGVVMSQTAREHSLERWTMYDRKYRESAGATKEVDWSRLNSSLWNRCFSGQPINSGQKLCSVCNFSGHSAWECPTRAYKKPPGRKRVASSNQPPGEKHVLCYPYNNKGVCDRGNECNFIHKCIGCGEDHPQLLCRAKRRAD